MPRPVIRLAPEDNVAVAARKLPRGSCLGSLHLVAQEEIPLGHKVAVRPIASGDEVLKFGVPIGRATRDIAPGELVHVHNIRSGYITNDIDHVED
jgi:altronate dehydratase